MMSLLGLFKEDNGNVSSMRVAMFIIVMCCMVDYMHAVFYTGGWKPSTEVITILLGSLGLKVGQKFAESKKDGTPRQKPAKKTTVSGEPVDVRPAPMPVSDSNDDHFRP